MSFETVVGNEPVKELFRHMLEAERIGHAYILEGKRGVGRLTMAKAFASAILQTDNPITHPDFTIVTNKLYDPSKKQENILVDTIRCLKKDVYIRPYSSDKKVYVLPNADTMQAPAQNSLLKIFEEPPGYCTIILIAENANSFLPTIRSRAPVLRLHPLSKGQVHDFLVREKGLPTDRAEQLAILSGGAIGRALELLEDEDIVKLRDDAIAGLVSLGKGSYKELYDFIKFLKQNRSQIGFIMDVILSWSCDIMHEKLHICDESIINADKKEMLLSFCGQLTREAALRFSEITVKYQTMIEQNANYSVAVLCMATEYWEEIHGRNYRS